MVVFGGLFASFGVMLLAEIKKYFVNKRIAEDFLYDTLLSLYSELMIEVKNTDVYQSNPDAAVPDNLYSNRAPAMNGYLYSLRRIDYSPYKENAFSKVWEAYKQNEFLVLEKHINFCFTHLYLAINQEKIRALEHGATTYHPTGKDRDVSITLRKMKANATERIQAIEILIDALSSMYENRYSWEAEKEKYQALKIGLPTENPELMEFFEE